MFNNKFLITLIGLSLAILAANSLSSHNSNHLNEGYLGTLPSFTTKVLRGKTTASDMYMVPGTFQANLSPRFSNIGYGAYINYKMPPRGMMASPANPVPLMRPCSNNPMEMGQMVQENYCNDSANLCNTADYAAGNYNEVRNDVYNATEYPDVQSMIPIGTLDSIGESCQPVIYDRYIYANRNSRLRSQGDPIRGDLPIMPSSTGWFRPSVQPQIDLQQGALAVIGGRDNQLSQQMTNLVLDTSGGAQTTSQGVIATPMMSSMFDQALGAGGADVLVTAYP